MRAQEGRGQSTACPHIGVGGKLDAITDRKGHDRWRRCDHGTRCVSLEGVVKLFVKGRRRIVIEFSLIGRTLLVIEMPLLIQVHGFPLAQRTNAHDSRRHGWSSELTAAYVAIVRIPIVAVASRVVGMGFPPLGHADVSTRVREPRPSVSRVAHSIHIGLRDEKCLTVLGKSQLSAVEPGFK